MAWKTAAVLLPIGVCAIALAEDSEPTARLPGIGRAAGSSLVSRPHDRARAAPPAASTIAAGPGGVLVIDGDSGRLARVNRALRKAVEVIEIGDDAGPLILDPASGRAYIVDRRRDRIAVVTTGGALALASALATRTDPV